VSGLFAFLAGSAFVFVDVMGESERSYSVYLGLVSLGVFAGTALARRALRRVGLERLIGASTGVMLAAGATMAALAWLGVQVPLAVAAPMFVFMAAYMGAVPQATAGALTPYPDIAGSAASLMSFIQFVIAASVALVVGFAFDGTTRPMASAIVAAGTLSFAAFRLLVRRAVPTTPCR
jgi:DHA1 family bicyclomycin/chloramphenicol resistance-like MFS transporter